MKKRRPHIIISTDKPPYTCSECKEQFNRIEDAQYHMLDKHPAPKKQKAPSDPSKAPARPSHRQIKAAMRLYEK